MKNDRNPKGPEDLRTRAEESLKSEPDRPDEMCLEEQTHLSMNCGCIRKNSRCKTKNSSGYKTTSKFPAHDMPTSMILLLSATLP